MGTAYDRREGKERESREKRVEARTGRVNGQGIVKCLRW